MTRPTPLTEPPDADATPAGPDRRPSGHRPRRVLPIPRVSRDARAALLFLAPALFGFLVFYAWPALRSVQLSLTDSSLIGDADFVGFDNYVRLVGDPLFWNALGVTAYYVAVNIGVQTVCAVLLAVMMHRLTRSMVVRGIILLPYLVPNVVVALLWLWILDYQLGVGNEVLTWMGLDRIPFFGSTTWAIPTIAGINVWRHMGYTALLVFAGLQTIPRHLYEAAEIDGASEWRSFWTITLPLLRPVLALVLVLSLIGSFQIFDTIAVTTEGGPVNSTRVIYYYIYELAFQRYDFGYAAAIAMVLFLLLAGVTVIQLRMMRASQSDLS